MYYAPLLAIVASTALSIGLYYMKRQAERLPSLGGGWRLRAWWAFVRDPWWLVGLGLQIVGYGLYLVALRVAPLSIVHTALNGGVALFVLLSVVGLGERLRPFEWLGVATVIVGLITLGASLSDAAPQRAQAHHTWSFSLALVAMAAGALVVDRAPRRPIGLSVASGVLLGLSGVFAKALVSAVSVVAAVCSVDLILTVATNLVGFAMMQAAMQVGKGVVVVPIFSTLSNLVPIVAGLVVYGERLPAHGSAAWMRPLSFVLALLGAALLASFGERTGMHVRAGAQVDEVRSR